MGGYGTAASYFDVFGLSGEIAPDGSLHIHFDGNGNSAATNLQEIYGMMKTDGIYTPGLTSFTGRFYVTTPSDLHTEAGTFTATLIP